MGGPFSPEIEDPLVFSLLEGSQLDLLVLDLVLMPLKGGHGFVSRHHEGLTTLHQLANVLVPGVP